MLKSLKSLPALTSLVMLLCLSAGVLAATNPTTLVKKGIDDILSVLNDKTLDPSQRRIALQKEIRKVIQERFEFRTISQSVLSNNWRKATGYEQDRFVEFFTQTLENTYFTALESYSGEEIKYVGEKIKGDRAVVDTVIVAKNGDIPVSYKLKLTYDEWFIYDVIIENVSMVSNYRNLYAAIIKTSGINGLLYELENDLKKNNKQPPKATE